MKPSRRGKILIVDDHPLVRRGLRQVIAQDPRLLVCGEAEDYLGGMRAAASLDPDLAIVDLTLKEGSGLDLVKRFSSRRPRIAALVLSMHEETVYGERARLAGASGYLVKQEAAEHVIEALHRILDGGEYFRRTGKSALSGLSDRELEVFQWIGRGLGTNLIAEKLRLSPKTIEAYRAHIKEKLGLGGADALRQAAIRWQQKLAA